MPLTRKAPSHSEISPPLCETLVEESTARTHVAQENRPLELVISERRKRELLARLGASLDCAAEIAVTLNSVAQLLAGELCDWCVIDLTREPDGERRQSYAHCDGGMTPVLARLLDNSHDWPVLNPGLSRLLHSERPTLMKRITDDWLRSLSPNPERLQLLRRLAPVSTAHLPLIAGGQILGWIELVSCSASKSYQDKDLPVLEEISALVSRAITNSRSYQQARSDIRSRDQFLSVATHELKTPLTSLHSLLQLLKLRTQGGKLDCVQDILMMIEKAHIQSARMLKLTEDLLDHSRIVAGHLRLRPEPADLVGIIHETLDRMEPELKASRCELSLHAPERLTGYWDRARIEEVILNLLSNAIKYGRERPITVRVDSVRGSDCRSKARVSIEDHGSGIAPEDQARIFDPFERAVHAHGQPGHGLGLYIVRQILNAHGGTIGVRSKLGQGAEFHFEIPCD